MVAARPPQAREENELLQDLVVMWLSWEVAQSRLAGVEALEAQATHEDALRELGEQDELLDLELTKV